jgi:glycosyltransferase involved in cell wall biosynthesis
LADDGYDLNNPLVSVIVPSFNQGKFIAETLESVLSQDYRPIEVLVMDGGSTDETQAVLDTVRGRPEVRIRSEPDEGVVDAVNKGLASSRGEILAIQSSDDTYLPGAISAAVDALRAAPDAAIVFGDVELMDEHSRITGRDVLAGFDLAEYLGRFTYIPQPSAFFRAGAARAVGGWRAEVSYAADADFWMRIALRFRVLKLDRLMARYRYHPGQRDRHTDLILRDCERVAAALYGEPAMTPRLARYVLMGVHLARYRYTPEERWLQRTGHLYRAALANPVGLAHPNFPKRELLPGRRPIWALLSRLKRAMGFRPRQGQGE